MNRSNTQFKQCLSNIISLISAIGAISVNSYVEVLPPSLMVSSSDTSLIIALPCHSVSIKVLMLNFAQIVRCSYMDFS